MKWIRALSIILLLMVGFGFPDEVFANDNYQQDPQLTGFRIMGSNGVITADVLVNSAKIDLQNENAHVYYVVTPMGAPNLTASQILTEVETNANQYNGMFLSVMSYGSPLEISASFPMGQSIEKQFKLQLAVVATKTADGSKRVLEDSAWLSVFDAAGYESSGQTKLADGTYEMYFNVTTGCAVHLGFYPAVEDVNGSYPTAAVPSIQDIINGSGSGLTYLHKTVAGEGKLAINYNEVQVPNNNAVDVFLVIEDSFGNQFRNRYPDARGIDFNNSTSSCIGATYDNGKLADQTDDAILCKFDRPLTNKGVAADYLIELSHISSPGFTLIPDQDYEVATTTWGEEWVRLQFTPAGLQKINGISQWDDWIVNLSVLKPSTIKPDVNRTHKITMLLTYWLLNEADKQEPLDDYYMELPKITNCSRTNNKIQLAVRANTTLINPTRVQYKVYYVVTPGDVANLTSEQIKSEVLSGSSSYIVGTQIALNGGAVTEIATNLPALTGNNRYKVHFAIASCDLSNQSEVIEAKTARTITFDRLIVTSVDDVEKRYANGYDVKITTSTEGRVYLGVYPVVIYAGDDYPEDRLPNPMDIINGTGSGLAYASGQLTQGATELIAIRSDKLTPNLKTDIFVVRVDALGNVFMDPEPFIWDVNTTGGLTIEQVRYQNNVLADQTDDQLILTLSDDVGPNDAINIKITSLSIGLASNTTTFKNPIIWLTRNQDFRIISVSGRNVYIDIYESGLLKFNRSDLFDNGILSVSLYAEQGVYNHPQGKFLDAYTKCRIPLGQSLIQEPDRLELGYAQYIRGNEAVLTDDYVALNFKEQSISNPGSSQNYKLELYELDPLTGTHQVSLTFSNQDFTVLASGSSVLLKFTSAGQAKIPQKTQGSWKVTLVDMAELVPVPNPITQSAGFFTDLSLSRVLSGIFIGGYPLEGFEPSKTVYEGVPIPYSFAQRWQGDYHSIITASSRTPEIVRVSDFWGVGMIYCSVPGEWNTYEIRTVVNNLSLGNIALNGAKLSSFSPLGTTFSQSLPIGSALPMLTAVAEHPDARVQVSGSGSLAAVYTYVIHVTLGDQVRDYKVNLSWAVSTKDNQEKEPKDTKAAGGVSTPVPSTAQATSTEIASLKAILANPDATTAAQLAKSIDAITDNTLSLTNDKQLYENLVRYDDIVRDLSNSGMAKDTDKLIPVIVQLSAVVEQKIADLSKLSDALTVTEQYLSSLKQFSSQLEQPNHQLERSAQEMLQKLADRSAVVELDSTATTTSVTVDTKRLEEAIVKQMAVVGQINELATLYFGETNVNQVSSKVTLAVDKPQGQNELSTIIPKEGLSKLKTSGIDKIAVQVAHTTLVLNTSELAAKENLVIKMTFTESNLNTSKFQKVVDFNVYAGDVRLEQFNKPIELRFEFKNFGISNTEALESGIFRLNEKTNQWDAVGGIVDLESGTICVKRSHLSQYTVMKSKKSFSDVNNSWAEKEIQGLLNKGIIQTADKFEPQSKLTRGEFAAWIAKAYGLEASGKQLPFKDLSKSNKNYAAIAAVYEQGLISGKSKTKFEADGFITEQEMAVIMSRTLMAFSDKKGNAKVKSKYLSNLKNKDVANWAQQDMALLMELGINGQKDFAKGSAFVTKETAAAIFSKAYL